VSEVISAFAFGEQFEDAAAEVPQFFGCALGAVAKQLFEFAKCQFDRIQIGRIGWQVADLSACCFDGGLHARRLVAGEVVHDHYIARSEHRHQLLLDPGQEDAAVDRAFDAQRCDESAGTQRAQEGRRLPASVRHSRHQPRAPWAATVSSRHVGLGPRLVDKDDSVGID